MNTQHTQGRLHVAGQDKVQIRSEKHQVAKAWSFAGKTGQENARRLVACWNACEGLHTESLERNKPLGDQLVDAINQRDEVLAALEALEALTKRLALALECVVLNPDRWWDQVHESLQAYRDLMDAWYPQEHVSPLGKD
jgi:hypothetical protein